MSLEFAHLGSASVQGSVGLLASGYHAPETAGRVHGQIPLLCRVFPGQGNFPELPCLCEATVTEIHPACPDVLTGGSLSAPALRHTPPPHTHRILPALPAST